MQFKHHSVLPGFGLTMGFTLLYLSLIVLIPLSAAFIRTAALSWPEFWATITAPRVLASYRLTFGASLAAALVNAGFGLLVAWVLVRYHFPAKKLVDALVDLPFALPTAVAGIALTGLYAANGWIGRWVEPLGIKIAFTPLGVFVALTFIGLPFVVRTVQPVLEDLQPELEEAAAVDGAGRFLTFWRIVLPQARGGVAVTAVFSFINAWNEFLYAAVLTGNETRTATVALFGFISTEEHLWGPFTASGTMIMVPVIAIALVAQRHIVRRIFMRLVQLGEGTADTRRRARQTNGYCGGSDSPPPYGRRGSSADTDPCR